MTLKDKLPVSYLLFTTRGRINRWTYWMSSLFIWTSFYVLYNLLLFAFSYTATFIIYPLLFWALAATAIKRLHDSKRTGLWLWLVLIPVFGPLVLIFLLGFKKGTVDTNRFGVLPGSAPDYFTTGKAYKALHSKKDEWIVNDVTQLNPIVVSKIETPGTLEELQTIIKKAD